MLMQKVADGTVERGQLIACPHLQHPHHPLIESNDLGGGPSHIDS